jgi:hypothetical protein
MSNGDVIVRPADACRLGTPRVAPRVLLRAAAEALSDFAAWKMTHGGATAPGAP